MYIWDKLQLSSNGQSQQEIQEKWHNRPLIVSAHATVPLSCNENGEIFLFLDGTQSDQLLVDLLVPFFINC